MMLIFSSFARELVEYKARLAGEICLDLDGFRWHLPPCVECMDLSLRTINTYLTKSVLERRHFNYLGLDGLLFVEL